MHTNINITTHTIFIDCLFIFLPLEVNIILLKLEITLSYCGKLIYF